MTAPTIPAAGTQAVNTVGSTQNFTVQWWDFFASLLAYVTTGPIGPTPLTGVTDDSDAASGIVGEYLNAVKQSGAAIPLVSATPADIVTLALTAGDWDVWADLFYTVGAGASIFQAEGWIGTTSATVPSSLPAAIAYLQDDNGALWAGTNPITVNGMRRRFSTATPATLYLSTFTSFSGGTMAAYGQLQARRVR